MSTATEPWMNQLLAALPAAEWQRWLPQLEAVEMPLGEVLYESGHQLEPRLLPDHCHRLAAVRDGGRRVGRDRRRRQRRHRRHLAVHGRRNHAEPRGRAKRRPRLPAAGAAAQGGIRPRRPDAAPAAALHAGADHADGADGGVQPPSFGRPAAVPLAAAEPGPPAVQRARDDAGADRQHARRAPRRRDRGGRQAAGGRADPATAAATSRCSTGRGWSGAPASATRWSRRNSTACCPHDLAT